MTKATSKIMNDKIYTIIGFLVFVLIVILTMSVFKGKHDQRVESLDFLRKLFIDGFDDPPTEDDPPYSTEGSSARSTVGTDTTGSSASNSGRSTVVTRPPPRLPGTDGERWTDVGACATETRFNWFAMVDSGGSELQATDGMREIIGEPPYTLENCQEACLLEPTCGGFTFESTIWKGTEGSCLFKGPDMTIENLPESYYSNGRAGKIATYKKCCDDECELERPI
jgi:hypothetical protein